MSGSTVALAHERAGRAFFDTLGLRVTEPNAGAPGSGGALQCEFEIGASRLGDLELESSLESQDSRAHVHLRVTNAGDRAQRVDAAVLTLRWSGHGFRTLRYLRHGWQSRSFTGARALDAAGAPGFPSGPWLRGFHHALGEPPTDRRGWHESDLVSVVGGSDGEPALLVGVYERGVSFGIVYARSIGSDVQVAVELCCESVLQPGETLVLESVRIELGCDPSALLEDFALEYGRCAEARVARPFVSGWCSWHWAFADVSEQDVLHNLEALTGAREEIPVEVVELGDGYQRAVGDWRETNEKFPRGLGAVAEEIRAAGFTAGLWTAPFCVVPESELFAKQPDWLLRAGEAPFRAMLHPGWSRDGVVHALDPSCDEVVAHLEGLFADLVSLGFRYLKLDFLFVAALGARARNAGLGRAARLRRGLSAIRSGAGEETFLLGSGSPLGTAVGIVDGMRIGPDVAPHWQSDPDARVPGIEETQPSTRSAIRSVLARAWMHRRLWLNDPGCLMVRTRDTGLEASEREALAVAIAATGGMCVVSDDLPRLSSSDRMLLRSTFETAASVDASGIPGAARVADLLDGEIATHAIAKDDNGSYSGFVNASAEPFSCETGSVGTCVGTAPGGGRLELAPHAGALLRSRPEVSLAVFCDFDGTFSVQDVGATLAERYAADRHPEQWERYERGEITAWEYNLEILEGLPVGVEKLDAFLRSVELDPGARELLAWCEGAEVPFCVLSDGFDWNLNRLQVIHRVRFRYQANRLRIEDGRWRVRAGNPNPSCGCGTGTCKAGLLGEYRGAHRSATVVHIGNGRVSDTCGAIAADAAFAKDSLAVELERLGEPFTRFETLRDVIPALEALRR